MSHRIGRPPVVLHADPPFEGDVAEKGACHSRFEDFGLANGAFVQLSPH
jgi:hypothetical protein